MNIYKMDRYRKVFADLFASRKELHRGWSTAKLAERIGVQPSHLTNVIKGRNHFSSDQIHALGTELGLSDEEISYLDLLMEWERAELRARKEKLRVSVQKIRDRKLRANIELNAEPPKMSAPESERYYLDPNIELMHLYLGTKNAPVETEAIAKVWGLAPDYIAEILLFLQRAGLVQAGRNRWIVHPTHQLLPSTSPLCKPNQMLKRMKCMEAVQNSPADKIYSFSGTLTMTEESRLHIQARFVEFLKEVEKVVVESEPESLYHLQFDLFPWLAAKGRGR